VNGATRSVAVGAGTEADQFYIRLCFPDAANADAFRTSPGVEDYQVALATYRAACERWPGTPITLRQGSGVCAWSSADAPHLKS
jgi:hypothetical protein